MASSYGIQNYLNTIIFCVVAKAISIIILGLLVFPAIRHYAIFLITVELGLVFIIIWSMVKISNYDKRMAKESEDIRKSALTSVSCPDYYVKESNADMTGSVCKNGYVTPDNRFEYKFIRPEGNEHEIDTIDVDTMFLKKTVDDACTMISAAPGASGWPIPWTDLRSKCSDISL